MIKWNFPSRDNGQVEGFTNPGMAWFKGDPLQALAREICQNSLDAVDDEQEPVKVEFKKEHIPTVDFPGTRDLLSIIRKCSDFWKSSHNENIEEFTSRAIEVLCNTAS